jgi:hypothetical protein
MMGFGFSGAECSDFIAKVLIPPTPTPPRNKRIVLLFKIENVAEGMNRSDANTN